MRSSTPASVTPEPPQARNVLAVSAAAAAPGRPQGRSGLRMAVRRFWQNSNARVGLCMIVFFGLVAIFAPYIAPQGADDENLLARLQPPSPQHWIGTDQLGREVFSRVILGAPISMTVGLVAVSGALTIGGLLGIAAGYIGGRAESIIMRIMDVMLAFPSIILAIGIVALRGPGLNNTILAVSIVSIPSFARVARASTLAIKEFEYVTAARAVGARPWRVLLRSILPNAAAPLVVQATLGVGSAILEAAALGFLGLGAQPPSPEWGAELADSYRYLLTDFWAALAPGLAIMLVVISFNLAGDGLHDALDPRLSGRG
jgi:peptide/nickel transport system permease protein